MGQTLRNTRACKYQFIKGFTTNPTLMRKAGATNYENHCLDLLSAVGSHSIFRSTCRRFSQMLEQAIKICLGAKMSSVKYRLSKPLGQSTVPVIRNLQK